MIITSSKILSIFSDFIKKPEEDSMHDEVQRLVYLIVKTNKTLWGLEDSARLPELGDGHVASAKKNIDIYNQQRNDLIREIDTVLARLLDVSRGSEDSFYSESPGMIIDRLSIIFIKLSVVQKMISLIEEDNLRLEYLKKKKILLSQIESIGNFFDLYVERLLKKEVFFEIQQPVKIYNDARVRKYIKHRDN
ncbi:MAG TPA: DUF4254 domain-containing protein [Ignavibacteria bacterium]|nr:DUF4254 domain-containing protein [Ignavibacteria bacterium]